MEKILALSWKQPFGTAMLYGKIETRVWNTNYRGLVLICTSKAAYSQHSVIGISGNRQFIRMCEAMIRDTKTLDLNGYAIAIGRLVDCRPMTKEDEDKCFVAYREPWVDGNEKQRQLYCHVYEDVKAIEPFPWKGSQGWTELDEETKSKIKFI